MLVVRNINGKIISDFVIISLKPYRATIQLPSLPKTTNRMRGSFWVIAGERAKWTDKIGQFLRAFNPEKPLTSFNLTLTRHSSGRPDFDGLVSSFKHIIDALKKTGVIADDNPKMLKKAEYKHEYTSAKNGFVTIQIEEVIDGHA